MTLTDPLTQLSRRLTINVSGTKFETQETTLARFPETLLGSPSKREDFYDPIMDEYYFERNRLAFDFILFYYQSYGRLVRPDCLPEDIFQKEVEFFELPTEVDSVDRTLNDALQEDDSKLPTNTIQRTIWLLFNRPHSSLPARLIAVFSVIVILLSVLVPCLETEIYGGGITEEDQQQPVFYYIELSSYVWFTAELLVRFIVAPKKVEFIKSVLNVIDFLTVAPYYLVLVATLGRQSVSLALLRMARIMRILRIFKLTRYSTGMKILMYTIYTSLSELGMFLTFIGMAVIVSASLVFYVEVEDPKSGFVSIPDAFWWAVMTITTVGYGDQYPVTLHGKFIACILTVFGVLIIAMPIFLFVANFRKVMKSVRNMNSTENGAEGAEQLNFTVEPSVPKRKIIRRSPASETSYSEEF